MDGTPVIAVIGVGSIGVAWAVCYAGAGHQVRLYDPDPQRLSAARDEICARLEALHAAGLCQLTPAAAMSAITATPDLAAAVEGADLVQECAPENLELKRTLFAEIAQLAGPNAVLASSTSFLPASDFASAVAGRERCLVLHPGNPPFLLRIVEVVPAPFTGEQTIAASLALLQSAGLTPIRLNREIGGFVFNRLQGALLREAYCLVRDGVAAPEAIDAIVRDGLALRWSVVGPFESADLNTRGGIAAHAERMGPHYSAMALERGGDDPWASAEAVAAVTAARRAGLPLADWAERVAWRDRQIAALLAARKNRGGS